MRLGYAERMDVKDAADNRMSEHTSADVMPAALPSMTMFADAAFAREPAQARRAHEIDDATLMIRYRDGDVRAFEVLYRRYQGPLYRYLQRLCRHSEAANDLYQEVWSKVIASRERYEAKAQFNTFLYRIAHNAAIDYFRRSGRQPTGRIDVDELEDQLPASIDTQPDTQASAMEVRASMQRALAELPAEQRDVFLLYEESGLSLEQIGQVTGVAMETAKSRLRYAIGKLRAGLQIHRPQRPGSVQS
jgi:RNA polymerase sigma-70 factor (ECF subfamily)